MRDDPEFDAYLEKRAESLGLPTDPAAYRDGGLAVAATAWNVQQADFIACMLRGADIPAWVEGGAMAAWYWHLQFGMHPAGIRVLVPTGRLEDAKTVLERRGPAAAPLAEEQTEAIEEEAEPPDPGYPFYLSARRLAYLLLIGPLAPVVFVLAVRLLLRIRRHRRGSGPSEDLTKAHRLALMTALIGCPLWGIFLGAIALRVTEHYVL